MNFFQLVGHELAQKSYWLMSQLCSSKKLGSSKSIKKFSPSQNFWLEPTKITAQGSAHRASPNSWSSLSLPIDIIFKYVFTTTDRHNLFPWTCHLFLLILLWCTNIIPIYLLHILFLFLVVGFYIHILNQDMKNLEWHVLTFITLLI